MTVNGKVMVMIEREGGGVELACGGEPDAYDDHARTWQVGVVWLAMTYETAYRWRSGEEDQPHRGHKDAASINRMKARERERWYA